MAENDKFLAALVDYMSLAYHEARNVRYLIRAGHLLPQNYSELVNLPNNREEAWKDIQKLRVAAKQVRSVREAEAVFLRRFRIDLDELLVLFKNLNWRHSSMGGNRWADITNAVIGLREAIDSEDPARAVSLVASIREMHHNTNGVGTKLAGLDQIL